MNRIFDTVNEGWREMTLPPRNLTQSLRTQDETVTHVLSFGVIVVTILVLLFMLWAALAPLDEITLASGQIVPDGSVQSVQNRDGGIVRSILVEEGQIVQAGQILLRLDTVDTDADQGQLQARQASLREQIARYRRFAGGRGGSENLTGDEQEILRSMVQARDSQKRVLADQLAQKQQELLALGTTRMSLEKNLRLTTTETEMYRKMAETGAGSQLMVLNSERNLNQLRGQFDEAAASQLQTREAIREIHSRMQSLADGLKEDAMKNVGQLEAELREIDKSLDKAVAANRRTTITAPVHGTVKGLAVHTIGAVIQPGEPLLDIVPINTRLIAEIAVSPADIGHVQVGQPVKIKVSTYDFSRFGSIPGRVETISASTFQGEDETVFYKVKVRLLQDHVGKDPHRNRITPGMTLQASIVTGEKTVLQYLLKPVHQAMDGALHEN